MIFFFFLVSFLPRCPVDKSSFSWKPNLHLSGCPRSLPPKRKVDFSHAKKLLQGEHENLTKTHPLWLYELYIKVMKHPEIQRIDTKNDALENVSPASRANFGYPRSISGGFSVFGSPADMSGLWFADMDPADHEGWSKGFPVIKMNTLQEN